MAKTAKFEYKCRRCSEIDVNPCTSEDNARLMLLCILSDRKMPLHIIGRQPEQKGVHVCNDGGRGVSDLIGYGVVDEI